MRHFLTNLGRFALMVLLSTVPLGHGFAQLTANEITVRIGILAFRGTNAAQVRWLPLVEYLTKSIEGHRFEFVPVTLASTPRQIETRNIDFLITNPGHYAELQEKFGLSTLSTRERRADVDGEGVLEYGTAIITHTDSDIRSLGDIKNRTIAAVSPDAFGGFQMAWHEFQRQNIDPFKDLKSIKFMGFPQDAIITAIESGAVEVGIVRSGLLELLAEEGKLDMDTFRVVQSNKQIDYPHMVSSQLYPEWPFASLPATGKKLRESVLIALLATQKPEVSQQYNLRDLWSTPLSYGEARKLVRAYNNRNEIGENSSIIGSQQWIVPVLVALLVLSLLTAYLQITRRRQRSANQTGFTARSAEIDEQSDEMLARFASLTKREREVLLMICNGRSSKIIAQDLGISSKTVEYHRANLLQKTQAGTTPQLVQFATRLGFDG